MLRTSTANKRKTCRKPPIINRIMMSSINKHQHPGNFYKHKLKLKEKNTIIYSNERYVVDTSSLHLFNPSLPHANNGQAGNSSQCIIVRVVCFCCSRYKLFSWEWGEQIDSQSDKLTDILNDWQKDRQTDKQIEGQTDWLADIQTNRYTDWQVDWLRN